VRRLILLSTLAAPALVWGLTEACAPIFGIVERYDGPTWCEADAQAMNSPYCDDFDYVTSATTNEEFPATINGAMEVTDAVAHSPPNSLFLQAAPKNDAGVTLGKLVSFGMPATGGLPDFECEVDFIPSELLTLTQADAAVAILAIGGQTHAGSVAVVALQLEPDGTTAYSLLEFAKPSEYKTIWTRPLHHSLFPTNDAGFGWVTLKLEFASCASLQSDGEINPCQSAEDGGLDAGRGMPAEGGARDGGKDQDGAESGLGKDGDDTGPDKNASEAGHEEDGGDAGNRGSVEYVVVAQGGLFGLPGTRFTDPGFVPIPYFLYGMVYGGTAATSLHVDNARCAVRP
jgi:hypothetical protein